METEKSPLGRTSVPRYTFLRSGSQPKTKVRRFQCCICGALLALLVASLIIIISYYLHVKYSGGASANSSQTLDDLLMLNWPLQDERYQEKLIPDINDEKRAFQVGVMGLKERDSIEKLSPQIPADSPAFRHQLATYTSKEARDMSRLGFLLNLGTREIRKCLDNDTDWKIKNRKPGKWVFNQQQRWFPKRFCRENVTTECEISRYRSANGTCNNLVVDRDWGSALRPFRRILLPKYEDGVSEPRKASDGGDLPSAREVSLTVHRSVYRNDVNFTVMLAVWGQFIDHDITATAISRGKDGSAIHCCGQRHQHPECFPVALSKSDPFYTQYNVTCMEFVRSAPAPTCSFGPREQLNQATSFLDGSVVYGNSEEVMNQLRAFQGGELKMLKTSSGELLPVSEDPNDGCNRVEEFERGRYCFLSGDARANENLLLTSMHLLLARQHNLIARELAEVNSDWEDERIFQETRKIVGAQIQHITYNEFLPSVLPENLMSYLNMSTKDSGYFEFYNFSVNPTIANVFASAAFRFGHTLLPGLMKFLRSNGTEEEYRELHKMLFNPFELFEMESLESFMKGALNTSIEKSDVYFSKEVTQKLFQKESKGPCGLDLVSLNIQRGRDHGLPSYPSWRGLCGLKIPETFDDLKGEFEDDTLEQLKKLYRSVDDLDLYTGALAERPVPGGLVGQTVTCLIADQFLRLKIGDRFWYETDQEPQKFSLDQLNEIRKSSLAKIICRTSGVNRTQPNVMRRIGIDNELKSCDEFSFPNFEAWREF